MTSPASSMLRGIGRRARVVALVVERRLSQAALNGSASDRLRFVFTYGEFELVEITYEPVPALSTPRDYPGGVR